jgi:hypothetical protein
VEEWNEARDVIFFPQKRGLLVVCMQVRAESRMREVRY